MFSLKEFPRSPEPPRPREGLQLAMFLPESSWRPPTQNIAGGRRLALDLETRDPELTTRGPGFKYGLGSPVGIAAACDGNAAYFPFDHLGGDNISRDTAIAWTRELVSQADEIVMANATYDIGWLWELGISLEGKKIRDIQVAEALLDEERDSYSLNAIALSHLGTGKDEAGLDEAAVAYGLNSKQDLWKMPARYVGAYGEADALLTLKVYEKQLPKLAEEGLMDLWELECKITMISAKMTRKGVPVDLAAAELLNDRLRIEEAQLRKEFRFDIWSGDQIGRWIDRELGLSVPRTEKGNYSVTKEFLEHANHPALLRLKQLRDLNRLRQVFVEDGILKGHYRGRIHASFRQTASDEGGTRSGRFSCTQPNLQQVPKRSEVGKLIRKLYVAEPGMLWANADYSSQEPRLQVHYALLLKLPGAEEARQAFIDNIKLYTFLEQVTGLSYDTCKMLVLGIGYGMGLDKMADTLGVSRDECDRIRSLFKKKAPFIPRLFDETMRTAENRGFIRTLLGRKARFDFWSPHRDAKAIKTWEAARAFYPKAALSRAWTSKAMNRLIQGSAADQTKLAMTLIDEAGIDMRLPVHDEVNSMVETEDRGRHQAEIMESAVQLKLPSKADLNVRKGWG